LRVLTVLPALRALFFKFVKFLGFADNFAPIPLANKFVTNFSAILILEHVLMNVREKAIFIFRTLDQLFPNTRVPLAHSDSYTLLIAVMLSAQCTDLIANKVSSTPFEFADNARSTALLPEEKIAAISRPCGLSNYKAGAILAISKLLMEKFGGSVPDAFDELESLPGVGHKIASVVMAQALTKRHSRWVLTSLDCC
jgi:3-methyladenine DNA glycosylase/8-oxoguanine DNA glycosylase